MSAKNWAADDARRALFMEKARVICREKLNQVRFLMESGALYDILKLPIVSAGSHSKKFKSKSSLTSLPLLHTKSPSEALPLTSSTSTSTSTSTSSYSLMSALKTEEKKENKSEMKKREEMPTLSVLVLSLTSRLREGLAPLFETLESQCKICGKDRVRLLALTDNRTLKVGEKRNMLLQLAQTTHVAFVDDDDAVAEDYIESILKMLDENPSADCVVFNAWVTGYETVGIGRASGSLCRYGVELSNKNLENGDFERLPNHLMVFNTKLARSVPFIPVNRGEDDMWANAIHSRIRNQQRIDKILYFYKFDVTTSTCYT